MKLHDILSTDLPDIDDSTKECVNLGQWLLFKSEKRQEGARDKVAFYLKAGASVYGLNEKGAVLEELDRKYENLQIDELYYFSDLPKPGSLSNFSTSLDAAPDLM
ncbi:hypothetical protein [Cupriavidus sp. a3]|uniref:hypothetical protein n=1 Tax=Cupriavidus sp. a3 TaxID=3242158 RepID=UPI003D9C24C4